VSLLNSISMGCGPMSMGAYRSVAPRGSIASLPQELCVSEDCDDDDVVALERGRDRKRFSLRTAGSHSRLQVRWRGANLLLCGWTNYLIRKR
jgi:hypothetical protein